MEQIGKERIKIHINTAYVARQANLCLRAFRHDKF